MTVKEAWAIQGQCGNEVQNRVWNPIWDQARVRVDAVVWRQVWNQIWRPIVIQTGAALETQIRDLK